MIKRQGLPVIYMPRDHWSSERLISMGLTATLKDETLWLGLVDLDNGYSQQEVRYLKALEKWRVNKLCFSEQETSVQVNKLSSYLSHGFINRHASEKAWRFAVSNMQSGGTYWPDYIANDVHSIINKGHISKPNEGIHLTARQQQVLQAIKKGKTNLQISQQLGVTNYTTKSHIAALFKKLRVNNRMQCIYKAEQYKLF